MIHSAAALLEERLQPAKLYSAVLRRKSEYESAVQLLKAGRLPRHPDPPKNWDSLAALLAVLRHTDPDGRVLDAGGEQYSVILKHLQMLGYRHLFCLNLSFKAPFTQKGITYRPGDITRTDFGDGFLDAITCLSVVEHGVDLDRFFAEAARILKPGGLLCLSADYWPEAVDTGNQMAFGVPIRIFTRHDIEQATHLARAHGLQLMTDLQTDCGDRVVEWRPYNLRYTFIYLVLKKVAP